MCSWLDMMCCVVGLYDYRMRCKNQRGNTREILPRGLTAAWQGMHSDYGQLCACLLSSWKFPVIECTTSPYALITKSCIDQVACSEPLGQRGRQETETCALLVWMVLVMCFTWPSSSQLRAPFTMPATLAFAPPASGARPTTASITCHSCPMVDRCSSAHAAHVVAYWQTQPQVR